MRNTTALLTFGPSHEAPAMFKPTTTSWAAVFIWSAVGFIVCSASKTTEMAASKVWATIKGCRGVLWTPRVSQCTFVAYRRKKNTHTHTQAKCLNCQKQHNSSTETVSNGIFLPFYYWNLTHLPCACKKPTAKITAARWYISEKVSCHLTNLHVNMCRLHKLL